MPLTVNKSPKPADLSDPPCMLTCVWTGHGSVVQCEQCYKMFILVILLLITTDVLCDSVEIIFYRKNDSFEDIHDKNIVLYSNVTRLNKGILPNTTKEIHFWGYTGEQFINHIEDLPELTIVTMDAIELSEIPEFTNLNKMYMVALRKNKILFIKRQSFSNIPVNVIRLEHNNIQIIESKSFGANLKELYLSCNDLTSLNDWFTAPEKIVELDLAGNKIRRIQKGVLSKMTSLNTLDLQRNQLMTLSDSLPNINKFNIIRLAYNKLTELKSSWFPASKFSIKTLFINFNKLTHIPKVLLERMNVTGIMVIDGNPWQCACYYQLIKLVNWDDYGHWWGIKDRAGEPRCVVPLAYSKDCVELSDEESVEYFFKHSTESEGREEGCQLWRMADL